MTPMTAPIVPTTLAMVLSAAEVFAFAGGGVTAGTAAAPQRHVGTEDGTRRPHSGQAQVIVRTSVDPQSPFMRRYSARSGAHIG